MVNFLDKKITIIYCQLSRVRHGTTKAQDKKEKVKGSFPD
jgi:hypothetical protein